MQIEANRTLNDWARGELSGVAQSLSKIWTFGLHSGVAVPDLIYREVHRDILITSKRLRFSLPSPSTHLPPISMAAANKLKSAGKKIIGYPEEIVPVVSSRDWVKHQARNPKQRVSARVIRCLPTS